MVKVWEQLYPGGDVTYTDASGETHTVGAQHRQTMPDAYPLPSTAPAMVTRKTPRGRKVPQQGRGSIKQGPWRECFKKCTIRWNALPDECPWNAECPPTSSKKNVWDAKQAQGVMCAYYDLYIACCLSSCTQIEILGPPVELKGSGGLMVQLPILRGIISAADNCFPCDNPSTGKILSIAYWTLQMHVGEYQSLAAYDSVAGYSIPFCADELLVWSIVSGGGSLTSATGLSTEYHAPDANENCVQNPVIKLTDCCGRTATLAIAVNAVTEIYNAIAVYTPVCNLAIPRSGIFYGSQVCDFDFCSCRCGLDIFACDGSIQSSACFAGFSWYTNEVPVGYCDLACSERPDSPYDLRSAEQKQLGCCPSQFL